MCTLVSSSTEIKVYSKYDYDKIVVKITNETTQSNEISQPPEELYTCQKKSEHVNLSLSVVRCKPDKLKQSFAKRILQKTLIFLYDIFVGAVSGIVGTLAVSKVPKIACFLESILDKIIN